MVYNIGQVVAPGLGAADHNLLVVFDLAVVLVQAASDLDVAFELQEEFDSDRIVDFGVEAFDLVGTAQWGAFDLVGTAQWIAFSPECIHHEVR